MIWYLHMLWNGHHKKSDNHLFPYSVVAIFLTLFLMLYIASLWLIYFITRSFELSIPVTCFKSPSPPLWHFKTVPLYFVSMFLFSFFFVFFRIPHISEIMQYLSFSIWHFLDSSMSLKMARFRFLIYHWVIFHRI